MSENVNNTHPENQPENPETPETENQDTAPETAEETFTVTRGPDGENGTAGQDGVRRQRQISAAGSGV